MKKQLPLYDAGKVAIRLMSVIRLSDHLLVKLNSGDGGFGPW